MHWALTFSDWLHRQVPRLTLNHVAQIVCEVGGPIELHVLLVLIPRRVRKAANS